MTLNPLSRHWKLNSTKCLPCKLFSRPANRDRREPCVPNCIPICVLTRATILHATTIVIVTCYRFLSAK